MKAKASLRAFLLLASSALLLPSVHAAVTWNAGTLTSTDGLWSTATNWTGDTAPTNGNDLIFDGTANQTNTNDIPLTSIGWLTLNNAGWNITLGTLTLNSGIVANGTSTVIGAFTLSAPQSWTNSTGLLTVTGTVANGGNLLTLGGAGDTTISSVISGAGGLTKQDAGTLTLSGLNSYAGLTTISAGTLKLGVAGDGTNSALGTIAAGTSVASGAALDLNGFALGTAEALSIIGTGVGSTGALTNSSGSGAAYTGVVTLTGNASIGSTGQITLQSGLVGNFNLNKVGAGTLILNAASARTGATATASIDNGILRVRNNTGLGTSGTANQLVVTVNNGGILELNNGITLDNGVQATLNNGGTVRALGPNTMNGRIFVSNAVAANNVTISTVNSSDIFTVGNGANDISGGNGTDDTITISGPGTVLLGQASDYIGNWILSSGTTQLGATAALGATPARTIQLNTGATLAGRLATSTIFTANPITISGVGTANVLADRSSTGPGGITYTFGALSIGAQTLSVTNANMNSGAAGVTFGATTLTGNSIFDVNLGAGGATSMTLTLGAMNDSSAGRTIIKQGTGGLTWGAITLSGNHIWTNNGAGSFTPGAITGGGNTLTLNGNGAGTTQLSSGLTFSGAGGLVIGKSGANGASISGGTITLGGTGGILINSGASTFTLGAASITASQSWTNNSSNSMVQAGVLAMGANTLTLAGGKFTFSQANTGTGSINLDAGNLIATVAGAFGPSTETLKFGGGNLELQNSTATTFTGKLDMTTAGTTITVNRAGSGSGVTHSISGATTLGGGQTMVISAGAQQDANTAYGLTLSGAKTLTGNSTYTINGNGASGLGTLSLITGSIDTQGATRTLALNSGTNTGAAVIGGSFTGTAGILDLAGTIPTVTVGTTTGTANAIRVSGSGTYTFNGTSTFTGGVILNNASATVIATTAGGLGATSGKVKFNVAGTTLNLRAGTTSFTSGIDSSLFGGTILVEPATQTTAVTHTLTLANTFGANTVTISPGSLANTGGAYGLTLGATSTLSGNAIFQINNNGAGVGTLTLAAVTGAGNSLTFKGAGSVAQTAAWDGAGSALILDATYSGIATLNQANSFTGGVTLNAGTLNINNLTALGTSAGTFAINGGTINNTVGALVIANTNPITVGNDFAYGGTQALTLPGTMNLGAATRTITVNGTTNGLTFTGVVSNGTGLTKQGAGTLVLSSAASSNSYTGTTTLSAGTLQGTTAQFAATPFNPFGSTSLQIGGGTLQLRSGGATGSGTGNTTVEDVTFGNNVTVVGNTTIDVGRTTASTAATNKTLVLGTLSIGANTVNVTGANTYGLRFGATTLTANTVFNADTAPLTLGALSDNGAGRTITKQGGSTLTMGGITLSGAHEWKNDGAGTLTVNGAVVAGANTLTLSGNGAGATNLTGGLSTGAGGLVISRSAGTTTLSGGTVSLGSGGITISASPAGGHKISSSITVNGSQSWTNNTSGIFLLDNATASNITGTASDNIAVNGTGRISIVGLAGATAYAGNWTISNGAELESRTNITTNGALGTGNININGGTVGLYFSNTLARTIGTGAGQIQFTAASTGGFSGNGGNNSTFTISGMTWGSTGFDPAVLVLQNATANTNGKGTLAGNIDLNGAIRTIRSDQSASDISGSGTFSGIISGNSASGIIKTGPGHHIFSNTNTYAGSTTITQGTLTANSTAALGNSSATNTLIFNGGTLRAGAAFNSVALRGVTMTATGIIDTNTFAVGIAGDITGAGGLTKNSTGTLTLSGTNNYSGTTTVNAGTLAITKEASLNTGAAASWTAAKINVKNGATLALNVDSAGSAGFDATDLATLLGTTSVANTAAQGLQAGATLALDTSTATGATFTPSAAITNSTGANGGAIRLTKLGAGTLILDQANTYTGPTTITTGTLQLGSGTTAGSLNAGSGIGIGTGATFAVNQTDTVTQGTEFGSLGGLGGFTQAGSGGTTILNQANTFSGTTTVSAGTLSLANALALQNSALNTTTGTSTLGAFSAVTIGGLNGSRDLGSADVLFGYTGNVTALTLNPQSGVSVTYSGIISNGSGTMSLTKTGAGTQILTGANSYTGATIVNQGTLTIGAGGSLSASSALQINGGTFSYGNSSGGQTLNGLAVGAGNSTVSNTATGQTLALGAISRTASIYGTVNFATLTSPISTTTGNTNGIIGPWATTGATTTLRYAVGSPDGSTATSITAFTGTTATLTTLANVTVATDNFEYSAAAATASNLTANTLRYHTGGATGTVIGATNTLTLNGLMNAGTGLLTISGGPTTGGLLIGSTGELVITANAQATTISAAIAGTGRLVYSGGAGALSLSSLNNAYTLGTVVNSGTLTLTGAANADVNAVLGNTTGGITLNGGQLRMAGVNVGASTTTGTARIVTVNGVGSSLFVNKNNFFATTGKLTGDGTLSTLDGGGNGTNSTYSFNSTSNDFTGRLTGTNTTINVNSFANSTNSIVLDGAIFNYGSGATAATSLANRVIEMSGTTGGATINNNNTASSNANTISIGGGLLVTGVGNKTLTLGGTNTGNNTFGGSISDGPGSVISLTKADAGTWSLGGTNTYTGVTTVSAGILNLGSALALQNSVLDTATSVAGGAAAGLKITVTTLTIGGLSGNKNFASSGGVFANSSGYSAVTDLTLNLVGSASYSGNISNGAGGMNLIKTGAGTQVLTGTSGYSGTTAINAGTLIMGDAAADTFATSGVTVSSGATLGGSGTIAGNLVLNAESALNAKDGGKLAPGNSPGVLTASGTTVNTGSIFAWTINSDTDPVSTARGTEYSGLNTTSVSGSGAVFQIVTGDSEGFADAFWTTSHNWTDIFKSADGSTSLGNDWATVFSSFAYSDGANPITNVATYGSFTWTSGGSTLTWTAVPEPTSALVGLLIGAGLLRRRRN